MWKTFARFVQIGQKFSSGPNFPLITPPLWVKWNIKFMLKRDFADLSLYWIWWFKDGCRLNIVLTPIKLFFQYFCFLQTNLIAWKWGRQRNSLKTSPIFQLLHLTSLVTDTSQEDLEYTWLWSSKIHHQSIKYPKDSNSVNLCVCNKIVCKQMVEGKHWSLYNVYVRSI